MNNRFKNYGLWVAVAALVGLVIKDFGLNITTEAYDGYVSAILNVLVLAGIITSPVLGKGWKDKVDDVEVKDKDLK